MTYANNNRIPFVALVGEKEDARRDHRPEKHDKWGTTKLLAAGVNR